MSSVRKFCTGVMKNKNYFVTTPIYYVNAAPHIGHLYSSVIADFLQRWHYMCSDNKVVFSTGSDEHGTKIQQAASKNKTEVYDYCTNISNKYVSLSKDFNIGYTNFIRTTDENHKKAVRKFWNTINENGNIYSSPYQGWYCVSDETFLSNSQLKEQILPNGSKLMVSAESGHPVEWTEEQNYMFKLSKFQNDLQYWLKSCNNSILPKKFHRILFEMLESDAMADVSVSRPATRVHWGVPVPDDAEHTIYVWMDALVNYLTAAGYPDVESEQFKNSWPPDVQVIGKDILKFHGIYWPAFLMAANLEPPNSILCHSHWTVDGQKMSKSKQNVACPFEKARVYTHDGLRYFLLREGVAHSDGNYSDLKVTRILNSELADTLGNLLSRCCGKALNLNQEFPKFDMESFDKLFKADCTKHLLDSIENLPDTAYAHYTEYNIYKSIDAVIATLHMANVFFETMKPWELKKSPSTLSELYMVLHITMETLRVCGLILQPVIPDLTRILLDKLNVDKNNRKWNDIKPFSWEEKCESRKIGDENVVLFKRILQDKTKNKMAN